MFSMVKPPSLHIRHLFTVRASGGSASGFSDFRLAGGVSKPYGVNMVLLYYTINRLWSIINLKVNMWLIYC